VRIMEPGDREIARGLVNYNCTDVIKIKGLQSDQVILVLGYTYEEVVHRDDLVLIETRPGQEP
jgi:glutamate 5-kinase